MKPCSRLVRHARHVALLAPLALAGACSDSPAAPGVDGSMTVVGSVRSAPTAAPGTALAAPSLAGIEVSGEGLTLTDTTDASGAFRLEVRVEDGRVRLRFRRGALDARLEIEGLVPGTVLRIDVRLDDLDRVEVEDTISFLGGTVEFEGEATLISASGSAPARVLRVSVADEDGTRTVEIREDRTVFEADGDLTTFGGLAARLDDGGAVRLEGDATRLEDGAFLALLIKAEIDDDDDGLDEFEGIATLESVSGTSPERVARILVTENGRTRTVDLLESGTAFDADGDYTTFAAALAALEAGVTLEVEGRGVPQDDGSLRATTVEVERD